MQNSSRSVVEKQLECSYMHAHVYLQSVASDVVAMQLACSRADYAKSAFQLHTISFLQLICSRNAFHIQLNEDINLYYYRNHRISTVDNAGQTSQLKDTLCIADYTSAEQQQPLVNLYGVTI